MEAQAEAARRLKKRRARSSSAPSRSYGSILFANTFTIFNLILAGFGAATLIFGNPRDALFLVILAANVAIGTVQEARAKRTLDKLAAIVVAQATVVRDGEPRGPADQDGAALPPSPLDRLGPLGRPAGRRAVDHEPTHAQRLTSLIRRINSWVTVELPVARPVARRAA